MDQLAARVLRHRATAVISIAGAALVLIGSAAHAAIKIYQSGETEDFSYFYHAAQAMLAGEDIYSATRGRYLYPPLLAFVLQPLALLPEQLAGVIWAGLTAVLLALAMLIAAREACRRWNADAGRAAIATTAAIPLLLFGEKIHGIFTLGQTDAIMLLGFACVLRWMKDKPLLAGFVVGLTANVKYLSLIFVPYFIWKRNYRAALASGIAFAAFILLPAIEIGLSQSAQFITGAFGGLTKMMGFGGAKGGAAIFGVDWPRSISITSAVFRFTRSLGIDDVWAVGLIAVICAAILAAMLLIARRCSVRIFSRDDAQPAVAALEWAVLVFAAVAFSPQTTARHLAFIVLAFVIAIPVLRAADTTRASIALAAAMALALFGLSTPWRALGLGDFMVTWRNAAGATWCALLMILALVWCGCCVLRRRFDQGAAATWRPD
jgi:alpha-1,2-mannosyltransferase